MRLDHAEPERFKHAMGSFASGVTVITLWDSDGRPYGMTANAFSSVSVDPLLVLVCLNRASRTYDEVVSSGRFGVNILSRSARQISDYCARAGADKPLETSWLVPDDERRPPALADALAYLDCTVHSEARAGTHAVVFGAVRSIGLAQEPRDPLVYYRGRYQELATQAVPAV